MLKKLLGLIFSVCLMLSCSLAAAAPASALFGNARYLICIHKQSYRLDVYQQGVEQAVCSYPIAVAKNPGDKQYTGQPHPHLLGQCSSNSLLLHRCGSRRSFSAGSLPHRGGLPGALLDARFR